MVISADKVTETLEAYTSKSNPKIPGIAFTAVSRTGVLYEGFKGVRGLQHKDQPIADDTVFFIASATKLITAVATLQLVEQGKLHLDDPIEKYVPEFGSFKILEGFNEDDSPIFRDPKVKATVRHVLTHTAGTSADLFEPLIFKYIKLFNLPNIFAFVREGLNLPLAFEPGSKWQYGHGFEWAGVVVEAITGQKLGDYFQQNIFGPLGLHSITFEPTPDMLSRLVFNHIRGPDGTLSEIPSPVSEKVTFHSGGRGLFSTASDYASFLHALLNDGVGSNGNRILKKETVDLLFADQTTPLGVSMKGAAVHPTMPGVVDGELSAGLAKSGSFAGIRVDEEMKTGRAAGSSWWGGLANTMWWVDRTKGVAGVFFSQLLPFLDVEMNECWEKCEQQIYNALK